MKQYFFISIEHDYKDAIPVKYVEFAVKMECVRANIVVNELFFDDKLEKKEVLW